MDSIAVMCLYIAMKVMKLFLLAVRKCNRYFETVLLAPLWLILLVAVCIDETSHADHFVLNLELVRSFILPTIFSATVPLKVLSFSLLSG